MSSSRAKGLMYKNSTAWHCLPRLNFVTSIRAVMSFYTWFINYTVLSQEMRLSIHPSTLQVHEEHIMEVLCAADMYLLPGLKRGCGAVLGSCLSTDSVVSRLKTARMFQLPHLEDQCTQFISVHIDKVAKYQCVCVCYCAVSGNISLVLAH